MQRDKLLEPDSNHALGFVYIGCGDSSLSIELE